MFELPELYETRDYRVPILNDDIVNCEEECEIPLFPCDKDVFHLCTIILEERHITIPEDPYDAVEVYLFLRREIKLSL